MKTYAVRYEGWLFIKADDEEAADSEAILQLREGVRFADIIGVYEMLAEIEKEEQ